MIKTISKLMLLIGVLLLGSANSRAQREGFIPVEGSNLRSNLDLAVKAATARWGEAEGGEP